MTLLFLCALILTCDLLVTAMIKIALVSLLLFVSLLFVFFEGFLLDHDFLLDHGRCCFCCWSLVIVLNHPVVVLYQWCLLVLKNQIPQESVLFIDGSVFDPSSSAPVSHFSFLFCIILSFVLLFLSDFLFWLPAFPLMKDIWPRARGEKATPMSFCFSARFSGVVVVFWGGGGICVK